MLTWYKQRMPEWNSSFAEGGAIWPLPLFFLDV